MCLRHRCAIKNVPAAPLRDQNSSRPLTPDP